MKEVVIVGGVRTAIGRMGGTIARFRPEELGAFALRGIVDRTGIDPAMVEDVVMGLSNSWHAAYNPARWAVLKAGLPYSLPGVTVERQCSSGLQAMNFAATQILAGLGDIYIAGGMESWSQCPWMIPRAEEAYSFTPPQILRRETAPTPEDSLVMGVTAENLVAKYKISRAEQDSFGFRSQERAFRAIRAGYFKDEIIPIILAQKKGQIFFDTDEHPRETTLEKLAALSPVFKKDGTVTAGTSSGRNDGAAAVLMMTARKPKIWDTAPGPMGHLRRGRGGSENYGYRPGLCHAQSSEAGRTENVGHGRHRNQRSLCRAGSGVREGFGGPGPSLDMEKLNPNGGAIAFGHPNGMSGTRLALFAIQELQRRGRLPWLRCASAAARGWLRSLNDFEISPQRAQRAQR